MLIFATLPGMASGPSEIEFIARALILSGQEILLCQNVSLGYFFLPGGHIEFGEPAAVALARELEEEAGAAARIGELVMSCEVGFVDASSRRHHEVNLVFHVELKGTRHLSSKEAKIRFEWVDLARISDLDVRPPVIKAWIASGCPPSTWISAVE